MAVTEFSHEGAADPAYTLLDQERMARARNYFAWQARLVKRELGRRVFEVGCGIGNFTGALLDREVVVAIDEEPDCVRRLAERYRDRGNLHAFIGDAVGDGERLAGPFQVDSCVCLNVLEHIQDDEGALRTMARVLPLGGVIVLIVPAFAGLYGPIDRKLGHFRRYSLVSFEAVAVRAGLRVKKAHYMNLVGFFGWWANARVFRRVAQSAAQIQVFDQAIVPWMSWVEERAPPPFGQSLFAVLEKESGFRS